MVLPEAISILMLIVPFWPLLFVFVFFVFFSQSSSRAPDLTRQVRKDER